MPIVHFGASHTAWHHVVWPSKLFQSVRTIQKKMAIEKKTSEYSTCITFIGVCAFNITNSREEVATAKQKRQHLQCTRKRMTTIKCQQKNQMKCSCNQLVELTIRIVIAQARHAGLDADYKERRLNARKAATAPRECTVHTPNDKVILKCEVEIWCLAQYPGVKTTNRKYAGRACTAESQTYQHKHRLVQCYHLNSASSHIVEVEVALI